MHVLSCQLRSAPRICSSNLNTQVLLNPLRSTLRLPIFLFSALLALSPFVAAKPVPDDDNWNGHDGHEDRHGCLSDRAAALIVSKFESLFVLLDPAVAKKILADDFQEISDSINFITPHGPRTVRNPSIFFLS